MTPKASDILTYDGLILLNLAPQIYLTTSYGIRADEIYLLIGVLLVTLLGLTSLGYLFMGYIESRYLIKYRLEVPLISALIISLIQSFFFYWIFATVQIHKIFLGKTVSLFAFSEAMSIIIPLLVVIYLSK